MTTASYMSDPDAMATRLRTVAGIILWCLWRGVGGKPSLDFSPQVLVLPEALTVSGPLVIAAEPVAFDLMGSLT
jgi:hypothetical protein